MGRGDRGRQMWEGTTTRANNLEGGSKPERTETSSKTGSRPRSVSLTVPRGRAAPSREGAQGTDQGIDP